MRDANPRSARGLAGLSGTSEVGEADSLPLARGLLPRGGAQWGTASPETPTLLSDPEVSAVAVRDCGEQLTELGESFGLSRAVVRASVARRLVQARDELPRGVGLRVVACYLDAPEVSRHARANRELLASVLQGAGLVNYPTEWWHWSYGDRYWALVTGAPAALYGAVATDRAGQ